MNTRHLKAIGVMMVMAFFISPAAAKDSGDSEERILKWAKAEVPKAYEELLEVKKEDPDEYYEELLPEAFEIIEYIEEVKEHDPDMAKRLIEAENLDYKTWDLAEACAATKDAEEKKKKTDQLKTMLALLFDIRQQEQAMEIKALEAEIKEIRSLMEKRKTLKQSIIDKRVREMVAEFDESLEWW